MPTQVSGDSGVSKVQDGSVTAADLESVAAGNAAPQRMLLTAAKVTTSGTSVDFSPADGTSIPSWAKRVTAVFDGVSTGGTSIIQLQLGTVSGVDSANYAGTSSVVVGTSSASMMLSSGVPLDQAVVAAGTLSGRITFNLLSSNLWVFEGGSGRTEGVTGRNSVVCGRKLLSGTLDRLRLTTVNGTDTFDAGVITLLIEG